MICWIYRIYLLDLKKKKTLGMKKNSISIHFFGHCCYLLRPQSLICPQNERYWYNNALFEIACLAALWRRGFQYKLLHHISPTHWCESVSSSMVLILILPYDLFRLYSIHTIFHQILWLISNLRDYMHGIMFVHI